jgi:hypothetical protein
MPGLPPHPGQIQKGVQPPIAVVGGYQTIQRAVYEEAVLGCLPSLHRHLPTAIWRYDHMGDRDSPEVLQQAVNAGVDNAQ